MHAGGEYHGHWRGTPHYLCPEFKAFGDKRGVLKYGDRVDVYVIGKSMQEVVAKNKQTLYLATKFRTTCTRNATF